MRAIAHTPPAAKIRELPKIEAVPAHRSSRIMPRQLAMQVHAPRWLGYATGKAHAFLVPDGPFVDETVMSVCKRAMASERLAPAKGERCKTCASAMAEDTRKRGTGLTEPTTDNVATGAIAGDPKDAEHRRAAELRPLHGDASEINPEIVACLYEGDRESAITNARKLDRAARDVKDIAPRADRTPVGNRDHGRLDGVAMVQGPNMPPVQRTWRNPVTGEVEPAAARLDGSLRERFDREIVEPVDRDGFRLNTARRSKSAKRRYRARKSAERAVRERVKGRGETFVPKGRAVDPVKREIKRLANKGEQLPTQGW